MDNTETKDFIEKAWDNITDLDINDAALITHVNNTIDLVDNGTIRVAEKQGNDWTVNQWIKKAVLLSFRINSNQLIKGPYTTCLLYTSPSPRDATLSRMPSSA